MFFTECLSYSELFNICIMHSAWYMYQGINSKFVFKIALSSRGLAMLPTSSAIKASFRFKFSCPQVASEDYNECFMFNLPCTDIFLEN